MPKDFLSYLAGITPVKPVVFLTISSIARVPALVVSTYIGASLQQGNYTVVAAVSIIACILMAIGFFAKDRIISYLNSVIYKKGSKLRIDSDIIK